jgi:tetraacyldisaccharide 4'-kinase
MIKLKKPKFWDYKKPNFLSYLLLPLTFFVIISNFFLNLRKKNNIGLNLKKICIGNIYIGGTGKTPLSIKIYQILNNLNFQTATIKKFYKDHADEQKMLLENTKLYCEKDRKVAINNAIKDNIDIAIFDDGLQDQSINYDLKFVCFNNKKWIGNGLLIPAGPLREKIESISKYDAVFLNGNENNNTDLKLFIKRYNKNIKIFETYYKPTNINKFDTGEKYIIFSGIGNPESFRETLVKNRIDIIKEIIFPDHYDYNQKDIDHIRLQAKNLNAKILTTEKDFMKVSLMENDNIDFLKIELTIKEEEKFVEYLKMHI